MAATMASFKVLLASNQPASTRDRIAMMVPPGKRNAAAGASSRLRKTGSERQVAPYVTNLAIALIVSAATNELFNVITSITAAVMMMATWGVKNR
jgi:hypothetical protein